MRLCLPAWQQGPLYRRKWKMSSLWQRWGHPQGAPNVTEFTVYQPYTQEELVDLSKQFQPMQGETLAAWLLWLWDTMLGPASVGVLQVLTERSRWMARETPLWKYEDPKGDISWQGSHPGYADANMGWFVWRYSAKTVSYIEHSTVRLCSVI